MPTNKSPGMDGLTVEFYGVFWDVLGPDLVIVWAESLQSGVLPLSCSTDYKVVAKAISLRLGSVLADVVHPNQTYTVLGRTIFDNLYLVQDLLKLGRRDGLSFALLSLDQEKVFDRVDHGYLLGTLRAFGFRPQFVGFLQGPVEPDQSLRIGVQHLNEPVSFGRGVRQGCPLSGQLFALNTLLSPRLLSPTPIFKQSPCCLSPTSEQIITGACDQGCEMIASATSLASLRCWSGGIFKEQAMFDLSLKLETIPDFNIFLERFLAGKVLAGSWLDHVRGWYTHRDDFNILFLTYEEMKKVRPVNHFRSERFQSGKQLNEKELDTVVENATFDKMKTDPRANYESMLGNLLERGKGHFLRKGIVGDWKNKMTVAQSERFDNVFREKMKDLSSTFTWDINDNI
ncbi:unnamed protein product [Caretta caretta]